MISDIVPNQISHVTEINVENENGCPTQNMMKIINNLKIISAELELF